MAKKITQEQVVQADLWKNTIDSTTSLLSLISELNDELKKTTKISKDALKTNNSDSFDGLKEANEEIERLNKSYQQKIKIDKERLKLENKIKDVEAISVKQLSELEVETKKLSAAKNELIKRQVQSDKERRKGNQEQAESLKLSQKEEEELKKITRQLTVANLQKAEATKLNKEQVKENLGLTSEYQKQSKKLNELRKELKDVLLVEGKATKETRRLEQEVSDLDRTLKDVDAAAGQFQRNVGNYPETLRSASSALLKTAAAVLSVNAAFEGAKNSLNSTAEGSESVREVSSLLSGAFSKLQSVTSDVVLDLFDFSKAITEINKNENGLIETFKILSQQFSRSEKSTENLVQKTKDSANAFLELEKRIIAFEKSSRPLEERLSTLNGQIEQQAIIAGDSTRSFEEISAAVLKGQDLQIKRSRIVVGLAEKELQFAEDRVKIANNNGGASVELLNAETEAIKAVIDAENQLKNEVTENEKELRQVKQDRLEIDLDILIDGFDNQKTINERRINNEKETLNKRKSLLEETKKLADESFTGQKKILEDLSNQGIDVDELLTLDATKLAKQIQLLGQSEIINTRTLEVLRERKIVLQDLEEAQQDLNDSQQEANEINKDIESQEKALLAFKKESADSSKILGNLEEERFKNEIKNVREKLENVKSGSIEELRLKQELNDLLLKQEQENLDKEQELKKKAQDQEIENRKKVIDSLNALNDKFFSDKLQKADEEINQTKSRESELQNLAAQGNRDAAASLAQNQKEQAEAIKKKEDLIQKEKQFQFGLSIIKVFNSELDNGANTGEALAKTGLSTSVLTSLISALPSFYDGTIDTGSNGDLDSNGGHLAMLHDNERVVDKKNNAKFGGVSNDMAANIVHDFNNDLLSYNTPQLTIKEERFDSNKEILNKFDTLEKSIVSAINNKETYLGSDVDTMKKLILQSYSKGNTKTKVLSKYRVVK